MKLSIFPIALMITSNLFAQKGSPILGKWEEESINGKGPVECPYQFKFNRDFKYSVLNICYGDDPQQPITEVGTWSYDSSKRTITLLNRKPVAGNDLFCNSSSVLKIQVKVVSSSFLELKIEGGSNNREWTDLLKKL